MSDVVGAIFILMLGIGLGAAGCEAYQRTRGGEETVRTDTVRIDRPIVKRDTVTRAVPVERRIYETVRDTVRDCFQVPRDYPTHGLVTRTPLRLTPTTAVLTYFQPDAGRFEQSVFEVPTPTLDFWAEPALQFTPVGTALSLAPGVTWYDTGLMRRDRLSAWGGLMAVNDEFLTMGWTAGIRYRFTIATF